MMNVSPVCVVRTKMLWRSVLLCAGISTFSCSLLAIHSFCKHVCILFTSAHLYSTNCVFFALDSISLSHTHSSIRIANFWIGLYIPFIQCHHQFFESFINILFYGSIASSTQTQCKQNENCFAVALLFPAILLFFRFIILPFLLLFGFFVRFAKVRQLSLENCVSSYSHAHIILLCALALFGSADRIHQIT